MRPRPEAQSGYSKLQRLLLRTIVIGSQPLGVISLPLIVGDSLHEKRRQTPALCLPFSLSYPDPVSWPCAS